MSKRKEIKSCRVNRSLILLFTFLQILLLQGCSTESGQYPQGKNIDVSISGFNSDQVKKYEKFELLIDLNNVKYNNPFNPADIDIYALFTSPSGETIKINGFYDNYKGASKWKIRFSPGETGDYKFQVFVKDGSESGESEASGFKAISSEHHGWIKPSLKNPHYFTYDDG
ncbi:MAG: DUF5060 domain-containing protein, partial [Bacteroidia bacterium]|nr:DUF5060 domain-containing protein [Bacteroidia bacterium]